MVKFYLLCDWALNKQLLSHAIASEGESPVLPRLWKRLMFKKTYWGETWWWLLSQCSKNRRIETRVDLNIFKIRIISYILPGLFLCGLLEGELELLRWSFMLQRHGERKMTICGVKDLIFGQVCYWTSALSFQSISPLYLLLEPQWHLTQNSAFGVICDHFQIHICHHSM
jgi:hypothetical protein